MGLQIKTKEEQQAHMRSLKPSMLHIFKFHGHKKWLGSYAENFESWERQFGQSDEECVNLALKDWVDNQTSEFGIKAPVPGDIRPYYTQRMERKRCNERAEDEKPKHLYERMSIMDFDPSRVDKGKLLDTAALIRNLRAKRPNTGAWDEKGRLKGSDNKKNYLHGFVEKILSAAVELEAVG